jgi:hypothetical protein
MLTQGSIKALVGLIEMRLRCLKIIDREDKREKRLLESCRDDLRLLLKSNPTPIVPEPIKAEAPPNPDLNSFQPAHLPSRWPWRDAW